MPDNQPDKKPKIPDEGVYRLSIQALCTNAETAGRILGAVLKQLDANVIDVQQHVVFDTTNPGKAKI